MRELASYRNRIDDRSQVLFRILQALDGTNCRGNVESVLVECKRKKIRYWNIGVPLEALGQSSSFDTPFCFSKGRQMSIVKVVFMIPLGCFLIL